MADIFGTPGRIRRSKLIRTASYESGYKSGYSNQSISIDIEIYIKKQSVNQSKAAPTSTRSPSKVCGFFVSSRVLCCLDKIVEHKKDFFTYLSGRWQSLFNIKFDVLLYDLTSIYFECNPPGEGKRPFGYSRHKRSDYVQVVIALIVTPDGFPLAYEVMPGNTSDKTTLADFLRAIEKQYGKAERTWIMDRGIPTEEVLAEM